MQKRLLTYGLVGMLAFASCQRLQESATPELATAALSRDDLDTKIWETVKATGEFNWNKQSPEFIWSALQQSDNVLSVGFKPANVPADIKEIIHTLDIKQGAWQAAKAEVLRLILESERELNPSLRTEDLEAFNEEVLPVVDVRVKNIKTVRLLQASSLVRYAEPMGYEPNVGQQQKSSSGCGGYTPDFGLVAGSDFTNIAPGAKASWNHPFHNIAGAWTKSTGAGIGLMVIDTGISPTQDNFGSQFNQGSSTGRSINKVVTLRQWALFGNGAVETSPNDGCGHGTAMAGAAAAPRGTDGNAAGVAYNSNLTTVRASVDVFLDESRENKGVADAYVLAGNTPSVRVTSMSLGRITSSSQIADAIRYAYNNGKLMFCAGGTSFGWSAGWFGVIFPATMSEVVAVTGVKDNYTRCSECHDGSAIDFIVVMEKASNGRKPLTTAMTDNQPGTVGGSSVATATTAGIASLVWARYPSWTRAQVLNRLTVSAGYYPNRSSTFGWGTINADAATN